MMAMRAEGQDGGDGEDVGEDVRDGDEGEVREGDQFRTKRGQSHNPNQKFHFKDIDAFLIFDQNVL